MPGIGGYGEQRLGCRTEQQIVDDRLVLIGDRGDLGWNSAWKSNPALGVISVE
jgi:hypothetical protein